MPLVLLTKKHDFDYLQLKCGDTAAHTAAAVFFAPGRYKITYQASPHILGGDSSAVTEDVEGDEDGEAQSSLSDPSRKVVKLPPRFCSCPLMVDVV